MPVAAGKRVTLRSLLQLVPGTAWGFPYYHRITFRRGVALAKSGADGREHCLRYLELWILFQSLMVGADFGAISLASDGDSLLHQIFVLLLACGATLSLGNIVGMTIFMLNVSACSPENYRTFALLAEGWASHLEITLFAAVWLQIFGVSLMPAVVLADPATLPVASSALQDYRVLLVLSAGAMLLWVPRALYHINTVSMANVRGGLIQNTPVLSDETLRDGPAAVINQVVVQVLASSTSPDSVLPA